MEDGKQCLNWPNNHYNDSNNVLLVKNRIIDAAFCPGFLYAILYSHVRVMWYLFI